MFLRSFSFHRQKWGDSNEVSIIGIIFLAVYFTEKNAFLLYDILDQSLFVREVRLFMLCIRCAYSSLIVSCTVISKRLLKITHSKLFS